MKVSASVSKKYIINTVFVFKCLFLIYPLELLIKFIGTLMGYQNICVFTIEKEDLLYTQNIKFMGVTISNFSAKFPKDSISIISKGRDNDPGLIMMGIVILFYFSVWGISKLFSGFIGADTMLVLYGFLLIAFGFILDFLLMFISHFLQKKENPVYIISIKSYGSLVLRKVKGNIRKLIADDPDITTS